MNVHQSKVKNNQSFSLTSTGITNTNKQVQEATPSPLATKLRGSPTLGHFSHNSTSQARITTSRLVLLQDTHRGVSWTATYTTAATHGQQYTVASLGLPHTQLLPPHGQQDTHRGISWTATYTTAATTRTTGHHINNTRQPGVTWAAFQLKRKHCCHHTDNRTYTLASLGLPFN